MSINPDRVTIDIVDHVAHVRLTRADKMNALDEAMFEGIIAAGHHLHLFAAQHKRP